MAFASYESSSSSENFPENDEKVPDFTTNIEQRICDFLDSHQIFYKSPIDKMYDYFDQKREEVSRSSSMSHLTTNEPTFNRKKVISCDEGEWVQHEDITNISTETPLKLRKKKMNLHLTLKTNHSEM